MSPDIDPSSVAAPTIQRRPIEHYEVTWRGLSARATYEPDAHGGHGKAYHVAHLQVQSAHGREPLPMTETGYKSLHLPYGEVELAGGVVVYVTRWLDAAALKPEWKAIERQRRQSCLF